MDTTATPNNDAKYYIPEFTMNVKKDSLDQITQQLYKQVKQMQLQHKYLFFNEEMSFDN